MGLRKKLRAIPWFVLNVQSLRCLSGSHSSGPIGAQNGRASLPLLEAHGIWRSETRYPVLPIRSKWEFLLGLATLHAIDAATVDAGWGRSTTPMIFFIVNAEPGGFTKSLHGNGG